MESANLHLQSLMDSMQDILITTDTNGVITEVNQVIEPVSGYKRQDLIGKPFQQLFTDSQRAQTVIDQVMSGENVFNYDLILVAKDERQLFISYNATALRDKEGNVTSVIGSAHDITERIMLDRMKDEFISTVSHELRTPLTSIFGSMELIASGAAGKIPQQTKKLIDIAYNNSERLVRLVNDILDIQKIESGKMDFDIKPWGLMLLVEQAIEANRAYAKLLGVEFVLKDQLPGVKVSVDGDRLIQVITNLLSNAAKFSPPNDVVVISVWRQDRDKDKAIRVAITDHGPGIPEEFRSRIFQKFIQADASDARQKSGTGLGLSISKSIIEKLGGQINFETEPNVKTTFYFDLPEWQEAGRA